MHEPLNSNIYLYKKLNKSFVLKDKTGSPIFDSEGNELMAKVGGEAKYADMGLTNTNSHTATHELFHELINNHQNATDYNKTIIDGNNQRQGHKELGGIFIY